MREIASTSPARTVMIMQYFEHANAVRRAEIDACLMANCSNAAIDLIVLLDEKTHSLDAFAALRPEGTELREVVVGARLSFEHVFVAANAFLEETTTSPLFFTTNADIIVPSRAIKMADASLGDDEVWCLSRWDIDAHNRITLTSCGEVSQDTWMWRGALDIDSMDLRGIQFGRGGCDNAIAYQLTAGKRRVRNPSMSVRTVHLHREASSRNWTPCETPRPYLVVPVT